MACRALRGVNLRAIANIRRSIRDGAILSLALRGPQRAQQECNGASGGPLPPPEQLQTLLRSEHRFTRNRVLIAAPAWHFDS